MQKAANATRMELLRLKRRLGLARRGHHLLKGKQDELLRRFMLLMEEYLRQRGDLHEQMGDLSAGSAGVRSGSSTDRLRTAAWPPPPSADLRVRSSRILNLRVPVYELSLPKREPAYGATQIPASYDALASRWLSAAPLLTKVGERERVLLLLADEIERTRRRVNALEYKLIPGLEGQIRAITLKLAETELGNLARLMRVKEIVQGS